MQQTLLAVVALLMATTYSIGVARNEAHQQTAAVTREIEEMATFATLEVMEVIRARPFDQAVADSLTTGAASDLNLFSWNDAANHFTVNTDCAMWAAGGADCDDLDDFHGITTRRAFPVDGDSVYFDVSVSVEYLDDNLDRAAGRTFNKRVTVWAQDVWPSGRTPFLPVPIELDRVFAYEFD